MRCPICDGEHSRVRKSARRIVNEEPVVLRWRRCMNDRCRASWRSYECYEAPTGEDADEKLRKIREIVQE